MRTKHGFNIDAAIQEFSSLNFSEACKSCGSGVTSYNDELYGELTFMYTFSRNKLTILFYLVSLECLCVENDWECGCLDNTPAEKITLNQKQYEAFQRK